MDREDTLRRLRERIVAFAASRISRDVAEDLAQEVLMLLHDKYPEVTRLEDLLPLSLQILRFKIAAARRKSLRRGEPGQLSVDEIQVPDHAENPAMHAERRELLERLTAAIEHMGDQCRELFRLKLLGRTFPEIQTAMKAASINTIYTWDARCRKQLAERLGGHWGKGA